MKQTKTEYRGFTLIELLVVIAIIAILAGILIPTIASAMKKAEIVKTKSTMLAIKTAVEAYQTTYGKLPLWDPGDHGTENGLPYDPPSVIKILIADVGANEAANPRKIVFLSVDQAISAGVLEDSWGEQYDIWLDRDYDDEITVDLPGTEDDVTLKQSVILRSWGPDSQENTDDDVWSYSK